MHPKTSPQQLCCVLVMLFLAPQLWAQQQPTTEELLQAAQQGQVTSIGNLQALAAQEGTWTYPVRGGMHTRMVEQQEFQDAKGLDAEFIAESSVYVTFTRRGPDLCNSGQQGVSDLRIIAMQPSAEASQDDGGASRLLVDQQAHRAVLYLRGEVREWKPSTDFCGGEKQMVEAFRGLGEIRLDYRTEAHFAPLSFQAYPATKTNARTGIESSGYFKWDTKTILLTARALGPGAPAALANGAVNSAGSVADALEMAREMSGNKNVPSNAEIEAALPEGYSLEELPITLTGQAEAGRDFQGGLKEWFLSYTVDLVDDGKKIADKWTDPDD